MRPRPLEPDATRGTCAGEEAPGGRAWGWAEAEGQVTRERSAGGEATERLEEGTGRVCLNLSRRPRTAGRGAPRRGPKDGAPERNPSRRFHRRLAGDRSAPRRGSHRRVPPPQQGGLPGGPGGREGGRHETGVSPTCTICIRFRKLSVTPPPPEAQRPPDTSRDAEAGGVQTPGGRGGPSAVDYERRNPESQGERRGGEKRTPEAGNRGPRLGDHQC